MLQEGVWSRLQRSGERCREVHCRMVWAVIDIVQKLLYGSDKVEPGFQRATLAQSLQRGFALGSVARGKELARKGQGPSSKQKPTLPVRTTRR